MSVNSAKFCHYCQNFSVETEGFRSRHFTGTSSCSQNMCPACQRGMDVKAEDKLPQAPLTKKVRWCHYCRTYKANLGFSTLINPEYPNLRRSMCPTCQEARRKK